MCLLPDQSSLCLVPRLLDLLPVVGVVAPVQNWTCEGTTVIIILKVMAELLEFPIKSKGKKTLTTVIAIFTVIALPINI